MFRAWPFRPFVAENNQNSLRWLLATYHCYIFDRLERIHEYGDPTNQMDRYISVTVKEHPHGYVQCAFYDNDTKIRCEASSGYYFNKPGEPRTFRLDRDRIADLARLGFATDDSNGNFYVDLDVGTPPNFHAIADFILTALHDGYGAKANSNLQFNAPLARSK